MRLNKQLGATAVNKLLLSVVLLYLRMSWIPHDLHGTYSLFISVARRKSILCGAFGGFFSPSPL